MKKIIGLGIMTILMALVTSASFAAEVKSLKDYTRDVKLHAFEGSESSNGLSEQKRVASIDKFVSELHLDVTLANSLKNIVKYDSKKIDALASIVAMKKYAAITVTDKNQKDSLENSANEALKFLSNSNLIGAVTESPEMSKEQLAQATRSLNKIMGQIDNVLVNFGDTEREAWTKVVKAYNKNVDASVKLTAEENLLQAIMDVKQVSKEKALEILKKLEELC